MFLTWCDRRNTKAIIWPAFVEAVDNTDDGILVRYECICGDHLQVLTGARAQTPGILA